MVQDVDFGDKNHSPVIVISAHNIMLKCIQILQYDIIYEFLISKQNESCHSWSLNTNKKIEIRVRNKLKTMNESLASISGL